METTRTQLIGVLDAAKRLLAAREDQMVTDADWEGLAHAIAGCGLPNADNRVETFAVGDGQELVRSVVPARGDPYEHRCPLKSFEAVAHAVAEATGRFELKALRGSANVTWTQAAVAFAFLKERGVVVPAGKRCHAAQGPMPFEDAMIEYHALAEAKRTT